MERTFLHTNWEVDRIKSFDHLMLEGDWWSWEKYPASWLVPKKNPCTWPLLKEKFMHVQWAQKKTHGTWREKCHAYRSPEKIKLLVHGKVKKSCLYPIKPLHKFTICKNKTPRQCSFIIHHYNIDRTLRALWLVKNPCFIRV